MRRHTRAFSLFELLCIIVVVAIIAAAFLPMLARSRARSKATNCLLSLKVVGLCQRIFASDNNDLFPFQLSVTNGGTRELQTNLVAQYLVLSNELSTPLLLVCQNRSRPITPATNWATLTSANISFFVGLSATQTNPASILGGENGFTVNNSPAHGFTPVSSNAMISFSNNLHKKTALPPRCSSLTAAPIASPTAASRNA